MNIKKVLEQQINRAGGPRTCSTGNRAERSTGTGSMAEKKERTGMGFRLENRTEMGSRAESRTGSRLETRVVSGEAASAGNCREDE